MCWDNILISLRTLWRHLSWNLVSAERLWIQIIMLSCVCIAMISSIMINVLSQVQNAVDVERFWKKISFHLKELLQRRIYLILMHFNLTKVMTHIYKINFWFIISNFFLIVCTFISDEWYYRRGSWNWRNWAKSQSHQHRWNQIDVRSCQNR